MIWGKVEQKGDEQIFKLAHNELEYDQNNIQDKELINYKTFLTEKYKLKYEDEEPIDDLRKAYNSDVT